MIYRLFGWWYRWQACKMAAQVVAGWNNGPDEGITPRIWSVTVFFERYMMLGGGGEVFVGTTDEVFAEILGRDCHPHS